jgi:hypothetical protein
MRSIDAAWEQEESICLDFCSKRYKSVLFSHNNCFSIPVVGNDKNQNSLIYPIFLPILGYGDGIYRIRYIIDPYQTYYIGYDEAIYYYEIINGNTINWACETKYNSNANFRFINLEDRLDIESISIDSTLNDEISLTVTDNGEVDFLTINSLNKIYGKELVQKVRLDSYEHYYELLSKYYLLFTGKRLSSFFEIL